VRRHPASVIPGCTERASQRDGMRNARSRRPTVLEAREACARRRSSSHGKQWDWMLPTFAKFALGLQFPTLFIYFSTANAAGAPQALRTVSSTRRMRLRRRFRAFLWRLRPRSWWIRLDCELEHIIPAFRLLEAPASTSTALRSARPPSVTNHAEDHDDNARLRAGPCLRIRPGALGCLRRAVHA
jgi:hypothetical protein